MGDDLLGGLRVSMGVTLPDGREGRIVRFSGVAGGDWEAEVVVADDPVPYLIKSVPTMWLEHVFEEQGMCTHCDLRTALLDLADGR